MKNITKRIYYHIIYLAKILMNEGIKSFWWNLKWNIDGYRYLMALKSPKERIWHAKGWNGEKIIFPKTKNPEVSIMILTYNNSNYTFNCLKSLAENTKGSFEVIITDNASTDNTLELLDNVRNVKIIRNKKNYGFGIGYNKSIRFAKGKYLLFMNNDIIATKNWLPPLLETIKRKEVGAVGAKLIFPNGILQDAGNIIWKKGFCMSYGRHENPNKPEYNFAREVDYCMGAALMVKKELFKKLGGFDERFRPIYFEDSDICFSIKQAGYKVIYQPKSELIHFESITTKSPQLRIKNKLMIDNKIKFEKKWEKILEKEQYECDLSTVPKALRMMFLARDRRKGKNLLLINSYDIAKKSLLLKELAKNYKITVVDSNLAKPNIKELQQAGIEAMYRPYINSIEEFLATKGKFYDIIVLDSEKYKHAANKYCKNAEILNPLERTK